MDPPFARGDGARLVLGIGQRMTGDAQLTAEKLDIVGLDPWRVRRHDDHRRHLEQPAGEGDALAVIAGGGGDDAALALGSVEQR